MEVQWKNVQPRLRLIFLHVDKGSILRDEVKQTRRTAQNAEISFKRRLYNVADDAHPVENRRADQNYILI